MGRECCFLLAWEGSLKLCRLRILLLALEQLGGCPTALDLPTKDGVRRYRLLDLPWQPQLPSLDPS